MPLPPTPPGATSPAPATAAVGFVTHPLDDRHLFLVGRLPDDLLAAADHFDRLWHLHPAAFHEIKMHGRLVKTPRWQQAYGRDYHYTGRVNRARPVPELLQPVLRWAREQIDARLNGILVNWYEGALGHYIGPHRDSITGMAPGAPIVTLSLGASRTFRLRPHQTRGRIDFPADDRTVFVMPYATNRAYTHEVPRSRQRTGRRISITLRAL